MQNKTIDNALRQLHRDAMNGKHEGLEHILALMQLIGVEPSYRRPSPIGGAKRRETQVLVQQALRDGLRTPSEIADRLVAERPDVPRRRAYHRVYMVMQRLRTKNKVYTYPKYCGIIIPP